MRIQDLTIQPDAPVVENTTMTPTVQRLLESDAAPEQWVEFVDADSFLNYCNKVLNG